MAKPASGTASAVTVSTALGSVLAVEGLGAAWLIAAVATAKAVTPSVDGRPLFLLTSATDDIGLTFGP